MMKQLILILGLFVFAGTTVNAQDVNTKDLCKKWCLKNYEYSGKFYPPEKGEESDYIWLCDNMMHASSTKGKVETGKWELNANKKSFLMYDKQGKSVKIFIRAITKTSLTLEFDVKEMKGLLVHYKNCSD